MAKAVDDDQTTFDIPNQADILSSLIVSFLLLYTNTEWTPSDCLVQMAKAVDDDQTTFDIPNQADILSSLIAAVLIFREMARLGIVPGNPLFTVVKNDVYKDVTNKKTKLRACNSPFADFR